MAATPPLPSHPLLWCILAEDAPIVAVFARIYGTKQYNGLLRWNYKTDKLDHGAWTTMKLNVPHCALSPDGEFLQYQAKGPESTPFRGSHGGGYAISRLPWLSALTNVKSFTPAGDLPSRDALTHGQQEKLWNCFTTTGDPGRLNSTDNPSRLPHNFVWQQPPAGKPLFRRLATSTVGPPPVLYAIASNSAISLLARVRWLDWNVWDSPPSFYLADQKNPELAARELPDLRWAALVPGNRIIAATKDARLQTLHVNPKHPLSTPPEIIAEHDLSNLTPTPVPAPRWAKAPL